VSNHPVIAITSCTQEVLISKRPDKVTVEIYNERSPASSGQNVKNTIDQDHNSCLLSTVIAVNLPEPGPSYLKLAVQMIKETGFVLFQKIPKLSLMQQISSQLLRTLVDMQAGLDPSGVEKLKQTYLMAHSFGGII